MSECALYTDPSLYELFDTAAAADSLRRSLAIASEKFYVDPAREALPVRIAETGGLSRPRDRWNATLSVTNFGGVPPSDTIIALERLPTGQEQAPPRIRGIEGRRYRLARRERWAAGTTLTFSTAEVISGFSGMREQLRKARAALGDAAGPKPRSRTEGEP